jgi:hypothetical protein
MKKKENKVLAIIPNLSQKNSDSQNSWNITKVISEIMNLVATSWISTPMTPQNNNF